MRVTFIVLAIICQEWKSLLIFEYMGFKFVTYRVHTPRSTCDDFSLPMRWLLSYNSNFFTPKYYLFIYFILGLGNPIQVCTLSNGQANLCIFVSLFYWLFLCLKDLDYCLVSAINQYFFRVYQQFRQSSRIPSRN